MSSDVKVQHVDPWGVVIVLPAGATWWWWGRSGGSGGFSVVRRGGEGGGRARRKGTSVADEDARGGIGGRTSRPGTAARRVARGTDRWRCSRWIPGAAPAGLPTVPSVAIAPEERTEERPRPGEVLFRLDATPRWFVRTRRGERGAREARVAARLSPLGPRRLKSFDPQIFSGGERARRGRSISSTNGLLWKGPGGGKTGRRSTGAPTRPRAPDAAAHVTRPSRLALEFRSLAAFDRSDRVSSSLARASRVRAQRSTRDGRISRATRWRTSPSRCRPWQITSPSRTRTCRSRRTMARYARDARRGPRRDIDPRAPPPLAPARSLPNPRNGPETECTPPFALPSLSVARGTSSCADRCRRC